MRWLAILVMFVATAGCASVPILGPARLLAQADREARDGTWEAALRSYDEYLARFPDDSAAPRVLEGRDKLAAMLLARAELPRQREEVTRLRDEVTQLNEEKTQLREEKMQLREEKTQLRDEKTQLHEELARREDALARTRRELAARRAEAERLRADIESLKQIDLKVEKRR